MVGAQGGEQGGLVVMAGARPVAVNLLHRRNIGAGDHGGGAGQVIGAVLTLAILDVVAEQNHARAFGQPGQRGVCRSLGLTANSPPEDIWKKVKATGRTADLGHFRAKRCKGGCFSGQKGPCASGETRNVDPLSPSRLQYSII